VRLAELHVVDDGGWQFDLVEGADSRRLWFERLDQPLPAPNVEAALVATVMHWMLRGVDEVRVHGTISRTLLRNLDELQNVWTQWRPNLYRKVALVPDDVVDDGPVGEGAVAAFSGGMDAGFTVFTHAVERAPLTAFDLRDLAMVQGFDIRLDEDDVYASAVRRAERMTAKTDLQIAAFRTNVRLVTDPEWEDYFGLAVSAVLLAFAGVRRTGLVGSSEPYGALVLPWGSTPIQDWMASCGRMEIRHDGAGFSRSEKARALGRWPSALPHLRVCHEGTRHDRNCGQCEKCIRTMLCFLSVGLAVPECFDKTLDLRRLASLRLRNDALVNEFETIVNTADGDGITGAWLDATRVLVSRHRAEQTGI
jgi:hypothetical protein